MRLGQAAQKQQRPRCPNRKYRFPKHKSRSKLLCFLKQVHDVGSVSWWQVGKDVLANPEGNNGNPVDPHNCQLVGSGRNYPIGDRPRSQEDNYYDNFGNVGYDFNPAHQTYDSNLGLISTTGIFFAY